MNEVSLEKLYGVLKTYELEQIQAREVYGKGRIVATTTALVANAPQSKEEYGCQSSGIEDERIEVE